MFKIDSWDPKNSRHQKLFSMCEIIFENTVNKNPD